MFGSKPIENDGTTQSTTGGRIFTGIIFALGAVQFAKYTIKTVSAGVAYGKAALATRAAKKTEQPAG